MCRSLLQKLKDEQATAVRNQQYPATSCPICFEDLAKPDAASGSPSAGSGAPMASAYKDDQSSSGFGASSSKSDTEPSAPPLNGRPDYESLLGRDKQRADVHQDKHKLIRCVSEHAVLTQSAICWVKPAAADSWCTWRCP